MNRVKGEMGLILVSIVWGSGFIATAIGLDYMSTYETLAGRFLVASILLGAFNFRKIRSIRKKTLGRGVMLGVFLFTAFVLQTLGLEFTTASKNAFLTAVCVAVVPFIGYLFHKRPLVRMDLMRAAVAMAGVGLISFQWSGGVNIGDFLSFLCAFAFGLHIFYTGEFMEEEDALTLTMVQMMTACVLSMAFVVFRGDSLLGQDPRGYLAVLYLGVFSTTICFLVMTISQKYTKPARAAVIMSTESLFAMVFSILILQEEVTMRMVLGAVVIFIAIILPQKEEEMVQVQALKKDAI